jgi:hypothetical protein
VFADDSHQATLWYFQAMLRTSEQAAVNLDNIAYSDDALHIACKRALRIVKVPYGFQSATDTIPDDGSSGLSTCHRDFGAQLGDRTEAVLPGSEQAPERTGNGFRRLFETAPPRNVMS